MMRHAKAASRSGEGKEFCIKIFNRLNSYCRVKAKVKVHKLMLFINNLHDEIFSHQQFLKTLTVLSEDLTFFVVDCVVIFDPGQKTF